MKKAILISAFGWYERRLCPIKKILVSKNYEVKILMSDFSHIDKSYISDFYDDCEYMHVPAYKNNISFLRVWSHICFGRKVYLYLKKYKPDLIYVLLPPNNLAYFCKKYIKNNPNCKYLLDVVDLWPESMPKFNFCINLFAKLWARLRDSSLKIADHIFLECALYKEKLSYLPEIEDKSSVLYLFKQLTEEERRLVLETIEEYKKEKLYRSNKIILGYLGSINSIIDIEGISSVIESIKKNDKEVEIRIIGEGSTREEFLNSLKKNGAIVKYYGKIFDQKEKIKILGTCDYGLNMMKKQVSVGLTIKSIDYLAMGLPIINNIQGDTWKFVKKYAIGINIDKSEVINIVDDNINRLNIVKFFNNMFSEIAFKMEIMKGL